MHFSFNKVLPFLLPLIQMISGSSIADLRTSLPSVRLIGSFSVGIEGLSAPLAFSHNLELPLVPLGQQLFGWSEFVPTMATQPQTSAPASQHNKNAKVMAMIGIEDPESPNNTPEATEETNKTPDESTPRANETLEDNGMQLAFGTPDFRATQGKSEGGRAAKKRQAVELELPDEGRATSKRSKGDKDRAEAQQAIAKRKHKKERKAYKRGERCKHCRHCGRQD